MFGRFNLNEPDAFLGNRPHLGFFIFRELAGWSVVAGFAALVRLVLWQSPLSLALTGEQRGGLDSHLGTDKIFYRRGVAVATDAGVFQHLHKSLPHRRRWHGAQLYVLGLPRNSVPPARAPYV